MTEDETLANWIANDLVARKPSGVVVLVTSSERAPRLRLATAARWQSMLAAFSSGLAHADQDADTRPAEATLAQLRQLEILVVSEPSQLPANVAVAYTPAPIDDAWRSALAGSAIVTLSDAPATAH